MHSLSAGTGPAFILEGSRAVGGVGGVTIGSAVTVLPKVR